MRTRTPSAGRRGFTLIEILMVVTIIGILAALLLSGVNGAMKTARLAEAQGDMLKLTTALEAFKTKYGIYPPSRIRLRENTPYNLNEGLDAYSVRVLKQIWPNINLTTYSGGTAPAVTQNFLWCKDTPAKTVATAAGVYELEGDECLVFFLGGIADFDRANVAAGIVLHGFTKRPTNPGGVPNGTDPATEKREGPSMDFDAARLIVRFGADQIVAPPATATTTTGAHGMPGFDTTYVNTTIATSTTPAAGEIAKLPSYLALGPRDKQERRPYAYFSGDAGSGYRPDDVNFPAAGEWEEFLDATSGGAATATFQRRDLPLNMGVRPTTTSAFPNPYTLGPSAPTAAAVKYAKAESYQLISPGADGKYGPGGQLPRESVDFAPTGTSYDNISNVAGSSLLGDFNEQQKKKN